VLLIGFDVMAQVPELQPTKFQYSQPAIAPTSIPKIPTRFFLMKENTIDAHLNF